MRHLKSGLILAGVCVLALAGCGDKTTEKTTTTTTTTVTGPADMLDPRNPPPRKPGLWEQTITAEGATMSTRICLDEATAARMAVTGAQASSKACPESKTTRTAEGFTVSATCNMGTGGTTVTTSAIKGDLTSDFEIDTTSKTTGAAVPHMNREGQMKLVAKWLGPCPDGMGPGDQQMPNGVTVDMSNFDPDKARALAKEAAGQ